MPALGTVLGNYRGVDSTADIEPRREPHITRLHCGYQVSQDRVGNGFMKGALVTIRPDILFQGLQFHTGVFGYIVQKQGGEVRLPGFRAQTRELRNPNTDAIIALWTRVNERLQFPAGGACC